MMKIMNNSSAMLALGETKKNQKSLDKQLKKLASGMKINGADDGAAEYSISERMRVRIRALGQNEQNVKTGYNLLRVAEGGVQSQLDIMRTIKQKVIDACNDTNTDLDRETIQKEIDHGYQQIDDIAYDTNYNGKVLLCGGDYVKESVYAWEIKPDGELVEGSDRLNVIPDNYDTLDELTGPFDIFSRWKQTNNWTTSAPIELSTRNSTDGTPDTIKGTFDYTNVNEMDDKGIILRTYDANGIVSYSAFVFSRDASDSYEQYQNYGIPNKVDISSCTTVEQAVQAMATAINSKNLTNASASGKTLILESKNHSTVGNDSFLSSYTMYERVPRASAAATGLITSANFSGGVNRRGIPGDPDSGYEDGTPATYTISNVGAATNGSGFVIHGDRDIYIRLVEGSGLQAEGSRPARNMDADSDLETDNVFLLGKDSNISSFYLSDSRGYGSRITLSMSNGTITLTASGISPTGYASGNNYTVTDGFDADNLSYTGVKGAAITNLSNTPYSGDPAKAVLDASAYNISSTTKPDDIGEQLENFIAGLAGTTDKMLYYGRYSTFFEFVDSGSQNGMAGLTKAYAYSSIKTIDLNSMRSAVLNEGKTISEAFANLMQTSTQPYNYYLTSYLEKDDSGAVTGISFSDNMYTDSNIGNLMTKSEATLGYYELDFSGVDCSDPANLHETGFRFYCATDKLQWYNIMLYNGVEDIPEERPKSGTETEDITTIRVDIAGDVSNVTNPSELVDVIYNKADADLKELNHYYRLARMPDSTHLVLYDPRRTDVLTNTSDYPFHNEKGAKIADGAYDNVILSRRNVMENRFVIQDTDKSSMHTIIHLPRTTIDHVLGYKVGSGSPEDYTVTDAEMRQHMLGTYTKGVCDRAIDYLLDAQTLLGAQAQRLEATRGNIIIAAENEQASESVIRDADMAKEMTGYAKANILSQTAQSMLAQANQTSSSVLGLLQ
ncbi:flagellin [Selenomonas ruminantium]|uniref:Flagellin n=1 Tax=Selenomonas ruminantium TaxID=971 RepID=A0A1H0RG59_SELRU|nr:flagellin [Selenomonas ruminantium]